ncbi:MAG: 4'-phosphopantetheinyl transferase family protein, partial [Candidatus Acidiferrum sp.]
MLPDDPDWPRPSTGPSLCEGEIQVWRIGLGEDEYNFSRAERILSADELDRAARFLVPRPRIEFTIARLGLRQILGFYIGCEPASIVFRTDSLGKPSLAVPELPFLRFNLTHSHGLALIGFALNHEIGVDVELLREMRTQRELAERFFHPNEVAALQALPLKQQVQG